MTTDKPGRGEEEYFAKREAELRTARREAHEAAERDSERQSHYMRCPKCGGNLQVEQYHGIEIDRCGDCNGIWFDAGEAELLTDKEGAGISNIFASVVKGLTGRSSST